MRMEACELTDGDKREFRRLWQDATGEDITPETAEKYAHELLGLVSFVAGLGDGQKPKKPP